MIKNIFMVVLIWNIVVSLLYAADKRRARLGQRRIREFTLIICAFLLGAYGAIMGMVVFNHKTSKIKFRILVPLAVVAETLILAIFLGYIKAEGII